MISYAVLLLLSFAGILLTPRKFSFGLSLFMGEALLLLAVCLRFIVGQALGWAPLAVPELLGGLIVLALGGLYKAYRQKLWQHWKSLLVLLSVQMLFQWVGSISNLNSQVLHTQSPSPQGYEYLKMTWELIFRSQISQQHYWMALGHLASLVTFVVFAAVLRLTRRKRYLTLLILVIILFVFAMPHWFVAAFDTNFARHIVAFCFACVLILMVSFFRKKRELLIAPVLLAALFMISPLVAIPTSIFLFIKYLTKSSRFFVRRPKFQLALLSVFAVCFVLVAYGDAYYANFIKFFSQLPVVLYEQSKVWSIVWGVVKNLPYTLFHYFDWGWGQVFSFLFLCWLLSGAKTSYLGLVLLPVFIVQSIASLFDPQNEASRYAIHVYDLFSHFLIWMGLLWSATIAAAQVLRVFRFGSVDTIKRIVAFVALLSLPWHKNMYALYVDAAPLVETIQKSLQK